MNRIVYSGYSNNRGERVEVLFDLTQCPVCRARTTRTPDGRILCREHGVVGYPALEPLPAASQMMERPDARHEMAAHQ